MGFPDFFLFDWSLPPAAKVIEGMGILGRILLHLAALLGYLV